jgi:hypothetical protein
MKQVIKDVKKQEEFVSNGFVKFPLLDIETNNILLKYYNELKGKINIQNSVYGIYVSLDDKDKELKLSIMDFLQKTIQPKLDLYLKNYKVHLGGFIVNSTNEIPQKVDEIRINQYHFLIEEATKTKQYQ